MARITANPILKLNRAVAAAMVHGPATGLEKLSGLADELGDHDRLRPVRGHLHEIAGDRESAIAEFRAADAATMSIPERNYLTTKAARLAELGVE